eukprot:761787-Pyramimonas_sp.AAC.1
MYKKLRFGRIPDYAGATVMLVRGVEVSKVVSGTIPDRQDAAVRLIRAVGIPRTMCWHASKSSNGCLSTRQFSQWTL